MQGNPAALEEIRRLGARSVPLVVVGDRYAKGQSLNNIIELLGLGERLTPTLSPAELVARADRILAAAQRFLVQFEPEQLAANVRDRERTLWVLGRHIFRIVDVFVEAAEGTRAEVSREALAGDTGEPPGRGEDIARYGEKVRERLARWWETLEDRSCTASIPTYYGDQSVHELLERSTWHAGQHVRQLMLLHADYGIRTDDPLPPSAFEGLPMPERAWDG